MSKDLKNLYILHILNDGFEASLLLLLPFIATDLHLDQIQVGVLGSTVKILYVFLALPAGYLAIKFGFTLTLWNRVFRYSFCTKLFFPNSGIFICRNRIRFISPGRICTGRKII
jgi:MFS-type transporter involved in bile tolerance (Atg22 family)